jgi:heme iron utilization protein
MTETPDPVAAADPAALALARALLGANHAALAYCDPVTHSPGISRIAFGRTPEGAAMTLISRLAPHYDALMQMPDCALLLGEPGEKGDPLTHPRLMLRAKAEFVAAEAQERPGLRAHWLAHHPKSRLYIDFADFSFVRFAPVSALLNGGFARAYRLSAAELLAKGSPEGPP